MCPCMTISHKYFCSKLMSASCQFTWIRRFLNSCFNNDVYVKTMDSSAGTVTTLHVRWPRNCGLIPSSFKRISYSLKHQDLLADPTSFLFSGQSRLFLRSKVAKFVQMAAHLHLVTPMSSWYSAYLSKATTLLPLCLL
jgi:hypothetical protein